MEEDDIAVDVRNSKKHQLITLFNRIFVTLYVKPFGVIIFLISLLLLIIILSTLALVVHPVEIDFSLSSLIVPTHHASIKLQSYLAAKHAMGNGMEKGSFIRNTDNITTYHGIGKRDSSTYSTNTFRAPPGLTFQIPLSQTVIYQFWTLDIVFIASGDNTNMLTEDRIQYVRYVEQEVTQHKDYSRFCLMTQSQTYKEGWQCTPPNSITTYFYPSILNGERVFDGNGPRSKDSIMDVLKYAFSVSPKSYWFVDENFTPQNMRSHHIRSQFLFGFPIKGYRDWTYTRDEQRRLYKDFIISYIPILERKSTDSVKVYFGSTDLYDHQAYSLFLEDLKLALGALILVYFYMSIHTFSFVLALFSGGCIVGSIGVTYFIIRVILGHIKMNVLNGISLFVILGIGVDDAFVFIDTYKQLGHLHNPEQRLKKTFQIAGKATLFTSATTSVAYSANIFSKIPAVSNFGYCMSFLVITCYIIVTLLMPAVLSLWTALGIEEKEKKLEEWCGRPLFNAFPWFYTTGPNTTGPNITWSCTNARGTSAAGRAGLRTAGRRDSADRDYENLTNNNLYDRLGDGSMCGEEPLYEVMSGENIYDRVDIGSKERHRARQYRGPVSSSKLEDSDSGVDPEEGSDESLYIQRKENVNKESYVNIATLNEGPEAPSLPASGDGLVSLTWLQKFMRNVLAPFIIKMRYVSIIVFAFILAFSIWGGTKIQTPNHPPEIFPRDSNIQHFINLSYDFTSTERCDKCSGYFADQSALQDRARKLPKGISRPDPKNTNTDSSSSKSNGDSESSSSSKSGGSKKQPKPADILKPNSSPSTVSPNIDSDPALFFGRGQWRRSNNALLPSSTDLKVETSLSVTVRYINRYCHLAPSENR